MSVSELELRHGLEREGAEELRRAQTECLGLSSAVESSLPASFGLAEIRETDDCLFAVGRQEVICFLKNSDERFVAQTARCYERYAPGVLTGARRCRLHGSHIIWHGEVQSFQAVRERRLSQGEHVALVLKHLPEEARLSNLLADGERSSAKAARIIAAFMREAVERNRYRAALSFVEHRATLFATLNARLTRLDRWVCSRLSVIAKPQALCLLEALSFLRNRLVRGEADLLRRGEEGFVDEAHGGLKPDSIFIRNLRTAPTIACLDWLSREDPRAYGDALSDAGTLCLELERLGCARTAERLSSSLLSGQEDTVRRFYRVLNILECCADADHSAAVFELFVRRALLEALGLTARKCAVMVDGAPDLRRTELINELRSLTGFHVVDHKIQDGAKFLTTDVRLEQSLNSARSALRLGASVVVDGGSGSSPEANEVFERAVFLEHAQGLRLTGRLAAGPDSSVLLGPARSTGRAVYAGEDLPAAEAALVTLRAFARQNGGL